MSNAGRAASGSAWTADTAHRGTAYSRSLRQPKQALRCAFCQKWRDAQKDSFRSFLFSRPVFKGDLSVEHFSDAIVVLVRADRAASERLLFPKCFEFST